MRSAWAEVRPHASCRPGGRASRPADSHPRFAGARHGFPSVKHFTCWLGLRPGTKITGGKTISGKTKRCANRAAQALRLAAAALRSSQSALGAYFRRLSARMDKPKAVTAAAHKLARLIYTMLTKGQEYYEERYRERVLRHLAHKAEKMGMRLVQPEQAA
jgi:hypothetical protein